MNTIIRSPLHARQAAVAAVFVVTAASLTACGFSVGNSASVGCAKLAGTTVPASLKTAADVCNPGNGITSSDLVTRACPTGGSYYVYSSDKVVYVGKPGGAWAAFTGDKSRAAQTAAIACK